MIIELRCPYCKRQISITSPSDGIGPPLEVCPYCNKILKSYKMNEWELMGKLKKTSVILRYIINAVMWSPLFVIPPVLLTYGLGYVFSFDTGELITSSPYLIFVFSLGFILSCVLHYRRIKIQIEASKIRMEDPEYSEIIKEFTVTENDRKKHNPFEIGQIKD